VEDLKSVPEGSSFRAQLKLLSFYFTNVRSYDLRVQVEKDDARDALHAVRNGLCVLPAEV
jgi:hypothetical protein